MACSAAAKTPRSTGEPAKPWNVEVARPSSSSPASASASPAATVPRTGVVTLSLSSQTSGCHISMRGPRWEMEVRNAHRLVATEVRNHAKGNQLACCSGFRALGHVSRMQHPAEGLGCSCAPGSHASPLGLLPHLSCLGHPSALGQGIHRSLRGWHFLSVFQMRLP